MRRLLTLGLLGLGLLLGAPSDASVPRMTCKVSKKPIKPQILTGNFDRFYAQRGLGTCKKGYWQHVGWLPKENMLVKVLPGHYWEGYSPIRVNEVFIYVAVEFQDGRKALVPANFVHSLDGRD